MINFSFWGVQKYTSSHSLYVQNSANRADSGILPATNNFNWDFGYNIVIMSCWFKVDSAPTNTSGYYVWSIDNESGDRLDLIVFGNSGSPTYRINLSSAEEVTSEFEGKLQADFGNANNTNWNHILVAYRTSLSTGALSDYKLFLNGASQSGSINNNTLSIPQDGTFTAQKICFGGTDSGAGVDGIRIDDAIWFRLTESASNWSLVNTIATEVYNAGIAKDPKKLGSVTPLNAWRMGDDNGGTGTTISNYIGSVELSFTTNTAFSSVTPF